MTQTKTNQQQKTDFDFLTPSGVKIVQSPDGYHFTSDSVQLAEFVQCKAGEIVIDVGCGNGVISLIINDRFRPKKIAAVDISAKAAALAEQNFRLNQMTNVETYCADVTEFHKTFGANLADVIVCNPPYFSNGQKSKNTGKAFARHDTALTLQALAGAATKLLKYGGLLYMCYPSAMTGKAVYVLESSNFRVKQLKFISNTKGVYLVLIKAKKGGGHSTKILCSAASAPAAGFASAVTTPKLKK